MDISDDSKLIVTCSADKNVKIWGLDFGDCHKSIFAHEESIMQVMFEKGCESHYFWTVSKDKMLKPWDGVKVSSHLHWNVYCFSLSFSLSKLRSSKDTTGKSGLSQSAIAVNLW